MSKITGYIAFTVSFILTGILIELLKIALGYKPVLIIGLIVFPIMVFLMYKPKRNTLNL